MHPPFQNGPVVPEVVLCGLIPVVQWLHPQESDGLRVSLRLHVLGIAHMLVGPQWRMRIEWGGPEVVVVVVGIAHVLVAQQWKMVALHLLLLIYTLEEMA